MSWFAHTDALPAPLSFHEQTPRNLLASHASFDEHLTTVEHQRDVQSTDTAISYAAAAASLRLSTVPPPYLPPLDQREPELIIDYERAITPGSAPAISCPPSFQAGLAGPEVAAVTSPSSHASGTVPYHRQRGRPAMPSSLAHAKLHVMSTVDMESERLARACGQGPFFFSRPSFPQGNPGGPSWQDQSCGLEVTGERAPPRRSDSPPRWHYPDFSGSGPTPARGTRSRPHSVRMPMKMSLAPPALTRPRSVSQPASIPVYSPSNPHGLLRSLETVLDSNSVRLGECLDVQRVHEQWAIYGRRSSALGLDGLPEQEGCTVATFGSPVCVAVKCASMSTVIGGYQHPIPWVVYACIEELNRTGIYEQGLFRAVPNRSRLDKLVAVFDRPTSLFKGPESGPLCPPCTPTPSNTRASLRKESTADVCALLKSYLDGLPEPLLDESIIIALHCLCVVPSELREQQTSGDEKLHHPRPVHGYPKGSAHFLAPSHASHPLRVSRSRSRACSDTASSSSASQIWMTPSEKRFAEASLEDIQIRIAQHLLRLATPPLCSLFAYLSGFFVLLLLCPDNGMALEDISRMFGRALAGGPATTRHTVLMWLLERWSSIADGLFAAGDPQGPERGEDVPLSTYPHYTPSATPNHSVTPPTLRDPAMLSSALIETSTHDARRGSIVSSDGAESVFTSSTAESDDRSLGIGTPFSGEFASLPLSAVREYESEPEWEDAMFRPAEADRSVEQDVCSKHAPAPSPRIGPCAIFTKREDMFVELGDSFNLTSDHVRSCSPDGHSPPPESDYETNPVSEEHSRATSRASDVSAGISRCPPDSPLFTAQTLELHERNPPRPSAYDQRRYPG